MTTSAREIKFLYEYYRRFVVGKENFSIGQDGLKLKDWIGEFYPKSINVIPLFETYEAILGADKTIQELIADIPQPYFRVFLARSDPALNYGFVAAVIITNLSLRRLQRLENESNVPIYPIIGMGSAPFRGNLKPQTVKEIAAEYSFCHTFTIQSAFKFDYPVIDVVKAVEFLNSREKQPLVEVDEKIYLDLAEKAKSIYQQNVALIASAVNEMAVHIPSRRMRKLHIGLFGYVRKMGDIVLPRAITYVAACYSLGLPPELLDLARLSEKDLELLFALSPTSRVAFEEAATYYNPLSQKVFGEVAKKAGRLASYFKPNELHREITSEIIKRFLDGKTEGLSELVTEAGYIRRFLG
jgi:phosphoenolpyruvate carboxylase